MKIRVLTVKKGINKEKLNEVLRKLKLTKSLMQNAGFFVDEKSFYTK